MADGEPLGIIELEDNLEDIERPPELPAGFYRGEVQDIQVATSGKGNSYYAIQFVIPSSEIPADVAEHYPDGARLSWNRQVVPRANDRRSLYNFKQLLLSLGLNVSGTQFDPNDMMGRQAKIKVRMSKWNGEDRAEIERLEPLDEATGKRSAAAPKTTRRK